jgi:hypothetical protein
MVVYQKDSIASFDSCGSCLVSSSTEKRRESWQFNNGEPELKFSFFILNLVNYLRFVLINAVHLTSIITSRNSEWRHYHYFIIMTMPI